MLNPEFRDILSEFSAASVEFLVIGAYAAAAYNRPRATGDIDLWVRCSEENAGRIVTALARFGALTDAVSPEDFHQPGTFVQLGVEPRRIDLITEIDGVRFEEAWATRRVIDLEGIQVPVISRELLIQNKLASGRPQDLADVEALRRNQGRV